MGYLDADTHVDECADTWSYLARSQEEFMPATIEFKTEDIPSWMRVHTMQSKPGEASSSGYHRFWFIDGQVYPRRVRSDERTGTTEATRELRDVSARVRDMDELGVDAQVLYPTLFLHEVTCRPDLERALCYSYNRWLADRYADSKGRLPWVAMLPLRSMPDAIAEARFAKENGACGIFKRGIEAGDLTAGDPYFETLYREVDELDLAVCIHVASAWTARNSSLTINRQPAKLEALQAFLAIAEKRLTTSYSNLRFGFIEAGSAWLPHFVAISGFDQPGGVLQDLRHYVTCEVSEDLPYLLDLLGDDNLLLGTDYGHADRAAVKDAHRQVGDREDLAPTARVKLTSSNARCFYGLES